MAEALVGGAFLSATLQVLFDRLASRSVLDFIRGRKLSDAPLRKLKIKLLAVNTVLNDAEEKQITHPLVKAWLDELKDVVYVAEDLLDEIATEAMQCKLKKESQASTDQVWDVSSPFLDSFDREMESKTEEILDRFAYILQQKDFLGLKQFVGSKSSKRLPTTSLVEESSVFGRDDDKAKIIEMLMSSDASDHEIDVIPIVGMGGVGKTTLAQLVYNDSSVKDLFDLKAWVCVSEEFDVLRVTETILEAVTLSACDIKDLNLLQVRLRESLTGKRFLLILDDVWNDTYNDWDVLKSPFRFAAKGSKIVVTTRSTNVASIMGSGPTHHLNQLLDEDCWLLFAKHAFDKNNSRNFRELEVIGKKIADKCKGLPLAAKTLGGLLRSKADAADWYKILKSELWELPNDKSSILPALRLSYHYLPSHLKCCFAYCAIFPKDYVFEKHQVVLLWMAEGFLQDPGRSRQMEEVGNEYFDELLSRSFFQLPTWDDSCFVMHDLVNDLAKYVSGEFCFRLEVDNLYEIPERTRHISYSRKRFDANFEVFSNAKYLRSFLSLQVSFCPRICLTSKVPTSDILSGLRCIRVLSLSQDHDIRELPDSIGNLKHLRYLDLSRTTIQKLPNSLSTLCNLQTLILYYCDCFTELPANLGKLVNLRHLDVRRTKIEEMPMHMSKLINLRTLTTFIVGKHNKSTITELRELKHLQGALEILNLQNVIHARDAKDANLKDKTHLDDLLLEWSIDIKDSKNARDVLEKLQPPEKLKNLTIKHFGGTRFPGWLGDESFSNMVSLCLSNCKYCFSLPPLGRLPSLRELSIIGFDGVERVGPEFYGIASSSIKPFGSLEILKVRDMLEWEHWFFSGGDGGEFPYLRELYIENCPKLKGGLPDHLPCLTKLVIYKCQELVASLPRATRMSELALVVCDKLVSFNSNDDGIWQPSLSRSPVLQESLSWSCLVKLQISNMSDLKKFPPGLMQSLAIKDLEFSNCPSLESFPMSGIPSTLKTLYISGCRMLDLHLPKPDDEFQMTHYCSASLEFLYLWSSCDSLKSFPLGLFTKLYYIYLSDSLNLESLWIPKGIHEDYLTSLSSLLLWMCPKLESFPKGGLPTPNLTYLSVAFCKSLKSLPERMHNLLPLLQVLSIYECPELESFPEGGLPSNLILLDVCYCDKLMACLNDWGLQRLSNLKYFKINGKREEMMESFPGEWLPPSTLTFHGISSLPNLKNLSRGTAQPFFFTWNPEMFFASRKVANEEMGRLA